MGFAKHLITATLRYLPKKFQNQLTAFLFIAATILFLSKKYAWWIAGLVTVIISQVLIFDVWKVAKFVEIAKIIILVAAIFIWLSIHFENDYKTDVRENMQRTNALQPEMLTIAIFRITKPILCLQMAILYRDSSKKGTG